MGDMNPFLLDLLVSAIQTALAKIGPKDPATVSAREEIDRFLTMVHNRSTRCSYTVELNESGYKIVFRENERQHLASVLEYRNTCYVLGAYRGVDYITTVYNENLTRL